MIPYFPHPVLHLGGATIHAYGVAVAAAMLTGYYIALHRTRTLGLDQTLSAKLYAAITLAGLLAYFALGHASSLATAAAGLLVSAAMLARVPQRWQYLDAFAFAIPFVLLLVRIGCFLAHDHIGAPTQSWLGVRFPGGTRYDLGLLHALAMAAIALAALVLKEKPAPPGQLFAVVLTVSLISRFAITTYF